MKLVHAAASLARTGMRESSSVLWDGEFSSAVFVGVLWLAVICFWLLDVGNNTSMEPYRALISDRLPKSQLARGFLTQSMFTGAGAVLANLSLFGLQKVERMQDEAGNGVPYWMYTC